MAQTIFTSKHKKIVSIMLFVAAVFLSLVGAKNVHAEIQSKAVSGTIGDVYYDTANIYTMYGTKHGQQWSDQAASLAVKPDGGTPEMVFCIQPGIPLSGGGLTTGYEAVEADGVDRRAIIASCIWQYVFPEKNQHEEMTARAVVWESLPSYGLNITSISGIPEFQELKSRLNQAIDTYDKKPNFNGQTIKLTFGKTITLDSGGADLHLFDAKVSNDANVQWNIANDGMSVNVTPTMPDKPKGSLSFKRSYMEGTPIIWQKEDSQTLISSKIKDPNQYFINFEIETSGQFQIAKVDKETGEKIAGTKFKLEFSGDGAPENREVVTGADGLTEKISALHGVHVKATEISVPAPYVLGSANGESDILEGDVKAGETLTLTQKNLKEKGQIIVEKQGTESGQNMWNGNYSLAGNVFEVHKDTANGEVIQTIATDEKGHAETTKDLPLGTYVVTEKQASNGFVNTFKPQTVKIEYENQTVAVVLKNAKGTNQEVTGSAVLTKKDSETDDKTQGKATFSGAEYALYHEDGTPVRWNESFKPILTNGTKLDGAEIAIRIDDKDQKAGVKHLALGKYFWKEIKAPEGYQIDNEKHEFELTYKDQNTAVIATTQTSKENVIKFTLDGFKYVKSQKSSAQSGYNNIEFKLTPIKPTEGKVRTTKTKTDENGYDGYWKFADIPYGDYELEEVASPSGYQMIQPLTIKSTFDEEKREYTFTIFEKGQTEPLKIVKKTQAEINAGSNVINLSKLFLFDDHVQVPETPEMSTLFVTVDGNKTFNPLVDQKLVDKVDNKFDKLDIGKTFFYVTEIHKIDNESKDTVIDTINSERKVEKTEFRFNVEYEYKANSAKHGEKLVVTHKIYTDKDHKNEYARHFDLSDEKQTLEAVAPTKPVVATQFLTTDGKRNFEPDVNQKLIDQVSITADKTEIGQTKFWVTQIHKIDLQCNESVVATINEERKIEQENDKFDVDYEYKAGTLKGGEKLVATHVVYNDKEHTSEYARHFDLNNKKQTLTANTKPTKNLPNTSGKSYPMTGSKNSVGMVIFGVILMGLSGAAYYAFRKYQLTKENK